jgi:3-deoxy-D-manno-octulosonate 8-phosphate phosphatase (KDO 8-P phosphatase)
MQKKLNQIKKIATKIKLLILDVDGVLTDNMLYTNDNGEEIKRFNVSDGLGISLALSAGIEIALISGRRSKATAHRASDLKINHLYLGERNKIKAYEDLKKRLNVKDEEIAYVGDDILDVPVLKKVALPICVKNANPLAKRFAKFVTKAKGGEGAVREVIDMILENKKINPYNGELIEPLELVP